MKRLVPVNIEVGSTWIDNQDQSVVKVIKVTSNSVRYVLEDLPDLELSRYRRGFLEDFTQRKARPFT
jgi:hypothetical protein